MYIAIWKSGKNQTMKMIMAMIMTPLPHPRQHFHVLDRILLEVPYRLHQWARATDARDMSILFGLRQRISATTGVCLPGGTAW